MSSNLSMLPLAATYAAPWTGALAATFLASIIFGIALLLAFFYYVTYPGDRTPWKVLVAVVLSLDAAALGLFMYSIYYYLILSWGNTESILVNIHPLAIEYSISAALVCVVQLFYINIVRALRAPLIITLTLVALSLTALGTSVFLTWLQYHLRLIPLVVTNEFKHRIFNTSRSCALICDVGIVVALRWLLRKSKSTISGSSQNNLGHTIMILALQRGVLQALIQAGELIAYVIQPTTVIFLPFHVIVTRIYTVSLFATLIMRGRAGGQSELKLSPPLSSFGAGAGTAGEPQAGLFTSMIALDPPFLAQHELSIALEERPRVDRSDTGPSVAQRSSGSDSIRKAEV